ncbi:MAG: LysR family transcriptional regulator [Planctomycetes bacterium]|nr:LysR family transcriptional regulator [Planctomycetota bacterium]
MPLRTVELFCDVVALRSFSKAASERDVTQSSVSQSIAALEKRLAVQLIDRSKRPFELTPAGAVYHEGCRTLLDEYRKLEDRVRKMVDKVVGKVRIAAIYSVGLSEMDRYVAKFRHQFPEVELRIDYLHPDEVYLRVSADEADLGLVSFPKEGGEFTAQEWQQQSMVLVVPPDHKLVDEGREQTGVSIQALEGEDFVCFTEELKIRRQIDRWLKGEKISVNTVHSFDNIENIKRAVEIGSGVSILPEPTVQREVGAGTLVALHFKDVAWHRPIGVIHRRNKTLSTAASKFKELLNAPVDSLPPVDRSNSHQKSRLRAVRVTKSSTAASASPAG